MAHDISAATDARILVRSALNSRTIASKGIGGRTVAAFAPEPPQRMDRQAAPTMVYAIPTPAFATASSRMALTDPRVNLNVPQAQRRGRNSFVIHGALVEPLDANVTTDTGAQSANTHVRPEQRRPAVAEAHVMGKPDNAPVVMASVETRVKSSAPARKAAPASPTVPVSATQMHPAVSSVAQRATSVHQDGVEEHASSAVYSAQQMERPASVTQALLVRYAMSSAHLPPRSLAPVTDLATMVFQGTEHAPVMTDSSTTTVPCLAFPVCAPRSWV